jgi:hypothetical protein
MDRLQSRRQGVRTLIVLLVVSAVIGGAGLVAARAFGPKSTPIATTTATSPPASGASGDPSEAPTTEPEPTEDAPAPAPKSEELDDLQAALGRAGYACFLSVTKPVRVDSCYLEPGTRSLDEQEIHVQSSPDGKLTAIGIRISYFEDAKASLALFQKTVHALEGTVLQRAEVANVIAGRTKDQVKGPGTHNKQKPAWGTSELFVSDDKRAYHLELVANGARDVPIAHGNTAVTIKALKQRYEGQKYTCKIDTKLESLKCQKREPGAVYTILAFDPCLTDAEEYELICEGHTAYSVSSSVGFGQNLPDAQYARIFAFLIDGPDVAMGGMDPETKEWVTTKVGDANAKVHRADFQQMHISIEPGAGVYEEFPNVFQVEVTGHNLTQ